MKLNLEAVRVLLEICYWRDYRYAYGERGTLLHLLCDVLEPLIEAEDCGGPEVSISGDWLRRFMIGYWRQGDGRYIYTIPTEERLKLIAQFLARKGMIIPAITSDHMGDYLAAQFIRDRRKYRFADQILLSGTFRGAFYGETPLVDCGSKSALIIYFVPGEDFFRVRLIRALFARRDWEVDADLSVRFDRMDYDHLYIDDLFASFGTDLGVIFDGGGGATELEASDFQFISKGRRAHKMTLTDHMPGNAGTIYRLCRKPEEIKPLFQVLGAAGRHHREASIDMRRQKRTVAAE